LPFFFFLPEGKPPRPNFLPFCGRTIFLLNSRVSFFLPGFPFFLLSLWSIFVVFSFPRWSANQNPIFCFSGFRSLGPRCFSFFLCDVELFFSGATFRRRCRDDPQGPRRRFFCRFVYKKAPRSCVRFSFWLFKGLWGRVFVICLFSWTFSARFTDLGQTTTPPLPMLATPLWQAIPLFLRTIMYATLSSPHSIYIFF